MEKDYFVAENQLNIKKYKNINIAHKSLSSYVNQLKLHFDLTDKEVLNILENTTNSYKLNNKILKKWWHIWK